MNLHIEHIESDNGPVSYWHVQRLLFTELDFTAARGLTQNLGLEAVLPLRLVRDRIRYEDLARQPFIPPVPDYHHRNETLTGVSDSRPDGNRLGSDLDARIRMSEEVVVPIGIGGGTAL